MAARHVTDTVRFEHRFVIPDAHAAKIRTARKVEYIVLEIFIPGAQ